MQRGLLAAQDVDARVSPETSARVGRGCRCCSRAAPRLAEDARSTPTIRGTWVDLVRFRRVADAPPPPVVSMAEPPPPPATRWAPRGRPRAGGAEGAGAADGGSATVITSFPSTGVASTTAWDWAPVSPTRCRPSHPRAPGRPKRLNVRAPRASSPSRSSSTRNSMFDRRAGHGVRQEGRVYVLAIEKPKRPLFSKKSRSVNWLLLTKPQ